MIGWTPVKIFLDSLRGGVLPLQLCPGTRVDVRTRRVATGRKGEDGRS
jgi:hypothetical protein